MKCGPAPTSAACGSGRSSKPAPKRAPLSNRRRDSLTAMLAEFVADGSRQKIASDHQSFRGLSLDTAIDLVARCQRADHKRSHHPHLNRTPKTARVAALRALRAQKARLASARSFDDLHDALGVIARGIRGLGPVWVYDSALALGAVLKHRPRDIYLHAGVAQAAKHLGVTGKVWKRAQWPSEFVASKLSADDLESFLCCFKDRIADIAKAPHSPAPSKSTRWRGARPSASP